MSTYPPRRCGLASLSHDLRTALAEVVPDWSVEVAAIDRDHLCYGEEVLVRVAQDDPHAFRRAGRMIAEAGVDVVVIQHEYGIFGGRDGAHILEMTGVLRRHRVPYVVILHTVLSAPTTGQAAVLRTLCSDAARVTVFTPGARRVLAATGLVDPDLVSVAPHGAPAVLRTPHLLPAHSSALDRALPPAADTPLLTTFGLLGASKGLEQVISALPVIVGRHPQVRYLIAGATHPEVRRTSGEEYRQRLTSLAERLHVTEHVRFVDAFLTEADLAVLLGRTTIYLTPYRSVEQTSSGTLAFAMVAGCPVVSTPYRYAVEMLTPRGGPPAGALIPADDPAALAQTVNQLLDEPARLARMRGAAQELGGRLDWPAVARRYARVLAAAMPATTAETAYTSRLAEHRLDHLDTLVDETGIIQFARGVCADPPSGYCVDDAARLAIVAANVYQPTDARPRRWLRSALRLLDSARLPGGMHNLMSADGRWCDTPHLGDHVGRAIWAAATVAATRDPIDARVRAIARRLLRALVPLVRDLPAPRSLAYATLGLAHGIGTMTIGPAVLHTAANRLDAAIHDEAGWHWFEPELTYDNARLPQALLAAATRLGNPVHTAHALSTLDWYLDQVGLTGTAPMLRCVGNRWRGPDTMSILGEGDEQPLDAAATVEALVCAWQATGQARYARLAQTAFSWFHGHNRAGIPVYDALTGGCHDGLSEDAVNTNEGAESTLAYHQALAALRHAGITPDVVAPAIARSGG